MVKFELVSILFIYQVLLTRRQRSVLTGFRTRCHLFTDKVEDWRVEASL